MRQTHEGGKKRSEEGLDRNFSLLRRGVEGKAISLSKIERAWVEIGVVSVENERVGQKEKPSSSDSIRGVEQVVARV